MYQFIDKGKNDVCLRPEGTAGVVRHFVEKKLDRAGGTYKWYYYGPMFRYERPQKGRLREFHQFGCEVFGISNVYEDANIIMLIREILEYFGIGFFNVPREYHHKVLFWGILGALLMRAIFIFTGVELIKLTYLPEISIIGKPVKINIILTAFGAFLVYAGVKSWFVEDDDDEKDFSKSAGAKFVYKLFKVSKEFDKDKFFTIENGVKLATPLLVVVGVIEFTDLLFAVDSIPAIFAIAPDDPFILYTSNIFAILGLRSLYFLLANFIHMFSRLKYGLAIILAFIGLKMIIAPFYHISSPFSLAVVGGVLILSVVSSKLFPIKEESDN